MVAIMVSMVAFLDGSVVNLALPAIRRDLGGGLSVQQWVVDGYLLAMGALVLPGGSISDLFGRVPVLRFGLVAFGAGSVLAATAPSPVMDLSQGFPSYRAGLAAKSPRFIREIARRARGLARDAGELRFVADSPDVDLLRTLMTWKSEHYRRIAYANDHFASGIPGWKTDRGMIYIKYGPADEVDSHPSGGSYERPMEEGGGETSTYPFEDWRYRYIEGVGTNVIIEFVDTTMSGEYHISLDPEEKDALLYVPGAGLTLSEEMGLSDKTQRFERTDGTHLGTGNQPLPESMNEFTRLEQFAKLQAPPAIKFKDLDAVVSSNIHYNTLPMRVRADYIRVTDATVLTNITVQFKNSDLNYATKDKISKATVNMYGRVTSLTRRPVNWFEDTVSAEVPQEMLQQSMTGSQIYSKTIPLAPGTYRLNIVAKDTVGNTMNSFEMALNVPHYDEDQLGASSVILADRLERVATNSIGSGPFVIRSSKVRPRVDDTFKQDETMGIYTEFYNFGMDEKTKKPDGTIEYDVVNASNQTVMSQTEDIKSVPNASAFLVTVEKRLPLKSLAPGKYTLKLKVVDKLKNQSLTPSAQFTVTS